MIGPFEFEHDGRTYACVVEQSRAVGGGVWWWFRVSGDAHRYAPFRAAAGDTRESVRSRIVAYYTNRLARRSAPPPARGYWARRQPGTSPPPK
jgi:hypothetical protein